MNKIAIFPGSFDPITVGHVDIVTRAVPLFDEIIVAIGVNTQKKYLFPLEQRIEWIQKVFKDQPNVKVESYTGLTVNYCQERGAKYIIRGIRSSADFEYEKTIAQLNHMMMPELDTFLILSSRNYRPFLPPLYGKSSSVAVIPANSCPKKWIFAVNFKHRKVKPGKKA